MKMYSEFKEIDVEVPTEEEESSEEEDTSKLWVNINILFAIIQSLMHHAFFCSHKAQEHDCTLSRTSHALILPFRQTLRLGKFLVSSFSPTSSLIQRRTNHGCSVL